MRLMHILIPAFVFFVPGHVFGQSHPPALVRMIEDPGPSKNGNPETLLFFSDGRVSRVPHSRKNLLRRLRLALTQNRSPVLDPDRDQSPGDLQLEDLPPGTPYLPSIIEPDEADRIFDGLNSRTRRRSQCYNRAHIWAYESFRNRSLFSMKVFMFFTLKYIQEYRYRWWFHVAPLTKVSLGGASRETVLDPGFMEGPSGLREWSDRFIRPKTECAVAEKYSEYEALQNKVYCVFMKVPMYYWQPRDLEALERGARPRKSFLPDEIDHAYWQAFY